MGLRRWSDRIQCSPLLLPTTALPPPCTQGMGVTACRAASCEELVGALREALERQGPSLIEAVL